MSSSLPSLAWLLQSLSLDVLSLSTSLSASVTQSYSMPSSGCSLCLSGSSALPLGSEEGESEPNLAHPLPAPTLAGLG